MQGIWLSAVVLVWLGLSYCHFVYRTNALFLPISVIFEFHPLFTHSFLLYLLQPSLVVYARRLRIERYNLLACCQQASVSAVPPRSVPSITGLRNWLDVRWHYSMEQSPTESRVDGH
jgi:hypothetical protein